MIWGYERRTCSEYARWRIVLCGWRSAAQRVDTAFVGMIEACCKMFQSWALPIQTLRRCLTHNLQIVGQ